MSAAFAIAAAATLAFALTNGFHDASNAIATLIATRAARPAAAVAMAAVANLVGPLLLGTAVADTVGGIVTARRGAAVALIGSAMLAAVVWNLITWWRGLPSSSGHALIGGLVGAGLVVGGVHTITWGGLRGWRPTGVVGAVVGLALSPVLGALAAAGLIAVLRALTSRASRRWRGPTRAGQWSMSAILALSHGANDAQKAVGLLVALLVADGRLSHFRVPVWAELACAGALTVGTAFGGWRIMRTIGRRIYHLHPLEGLSSQTASAGVILVASLAGAPVSTTHVVASSVVGVGAGRRRWRHIHWQVVRAIAAAWLTTIPATAVLGALAVVIWRAL